MRAGGAGFFTISQVRTCSGHTLPPHVSLLESRALTTRTDEKSPNRGIYVTITVIQQSRDTRQGTHLSKTHPLSNHPPSSRLLISERRLACFEIQQN